MADNSYLADLVAWLPRLNRSGWRPWGFGPREAPVAVAVLRRALHATDVVLIRPEGPVMAYRAPLTTGLDALRAQLVCWAFSGTLGPVITATHQARSRYGAVRTMPLACRPPTTPPWPYPMPVPPPGHTPATGGTPSPTAAATASSGMPVWSPPVSSVPLPGTDPWATFLGLRRLGELTAAGWLMQRLTTDADRLEIPGARVWPGGWADALLIRALTDAVAVRRDPHNAVVWQCHGDVDTVMDELAALPPPPPPDHRQASLAPTTPRPGMA